MQAVGRGLVVYRVRRYLAAVSFLLGAGPAAATDFTAGVVAEKMSPADRYTFTAGVAEGLAYSRYLKDGKTTEGMACIYKWFYAEGTTAKIDEAFRKFPDYMPAPVMMALSNKECGE